MFYIHLFTSLKGDNARNAFAKHFSRERIKFLALSCTTDIFAATLIKITM